MNDHDAFIAGIAADSDCNVPRLAFTDWLQEHDQTDLTDRAEFVRLQIEVANLPLGEWPLPSTKRRIRELLECHERAWYGDLAADMQPHQFGAIESFDRGFPRRIDCHPNGIERLRHLTMAPVWSLIPNTGPDEENVNLTGLIRTLQTHPQRDRIQSLDLGYLSNSTVPIEQMQQLLTDVPWPNLKHLEIGYIDRQVGPDQDQQVYSAAQLVAQAPNLTTLRSLDLCITTGQTEPPCGDWLAHAEHLSGLTRLRIGTIQVGSRDLQALAISPYLTNLESLTIDSHSLPLWALEELIESDVVDKLTELSLISCDDPDGLVHAVVTSPRLRSLRHFELQNISDEGLEMILSGSALPHLRVLTVGGGRLSPRAVELLANAPRLAQLTGLDLRSMGYCTNGLIALVGSEFTTNLQYLNLDNGLSEGVLRALVDSPYLDNIRSLQLGFLRRSVEPVLATLRERFGAAVEAVLVDDIPF